MTQFTITFNLVSEDDPDQVQALVEDFLSEEFDDGLDPKITDVRVQFV